MKNSTKYIFFHTMSSVALVMVTGSIIQAFMLNNGVGEKQVTAYLSVVQLVQVAAMLLFSLFVDRVKNVLRTFALAQLFPVSLIFAQAFFCIVPAPSVGVLYSVLFTVGLAVNAVQAVYNTLNYKVPYHIFSMKEYGENTARAGVAVGILGTVFSAGMSYFTAKYDYNAAMLVFFIIGIALLTFAFIITLSIKPIEPIEKTKKEKPINIFRYKPFYMLIIPNLLRGFCSGILLVSMTIGHREGITDNSSSAVLTTLLQLATLIACFIYSVIAKFGKEGKILLFAGIALGVTMPVMFVSSSKLLFYVMYFLANFSNVFIDYCVPVSVVKIVEYEYIGQYSSYRMLLHTLGIALSSAVVMNMVESLGATLTAVIAVLCMQVCTFTYYIYLKRIKN